MSVSLVQLLTGIADAIREKKGTTGKINAQNMAFEIKSIEPPLDTIELKDPGKYDVKEYKYAQVLPSDVLAEFIGNLEGTATEIHIPEGTTKLRRGAIYGSVEDFSVSPAIKGAMIYIPTSVKSIDLDVFAFSSNLFAQKITYAGTLKEWVENKLGPGNYGYYLYANNEPITEINDVSSFPFRTDEWGALGGIILDRLILPNEASIGQYAFSRIKAKEIIFEGTITGDFAYGIFKNVKECKKIILPTNITRIYSQTFAYSAIDELTIPEGVTEIDGSAFEYSAIENLILPSTLTKIGGSTQGVSSYSVRSTIVINATTPPTATGAPFNTSYKPKVIYIPAGTLTAYQTATNWATYKDIFVEMNEIALNIQAELLNNEEYQYSVDGGVTWSVFASGTINLSEIGFIMFKNTNETTKLLIGKSAGATDIGSITDAELTYATEGSMTIYLRLEEVTA